MAKRNKMYLGIYTHRYDTDNSINSLVVLVILYDLLIIIKIKKITKWYEHNIVFF